MRENFNDIFAFLIVAREGSFTKAAAQLGVSQSALSQTVRGLEARLGVRLLTRTTRSVTPTAAGERLLGRISPSFQDIESEIAALSVLRDKPAGTIRISAPFHAAEAIIWPKLEGFLRDYPDIHVEVNVEHRLIDIVAERYDAGVRLGERVAKDMVAVRISRDSRMAVVGSPRYFSARQQPVTPKDLAQHNCINLRFPTYGGLMPWEFQKDGHALSVQVNGQCVFNLSPMVLHAALAGHGLAYLPESVADEYVATGHLIRVLEDWSQPISGYHLYYASHRLTSPAFALFVEAMRETGDGKIAQNPNCDT
ncbi:DNA-binding transcriptional regulator, LysR family [Cupriavidus sp. YR651]|uniref:LysR family transcriptional regulator n=1 Tax=Cupriavidus sp. YR651 TaxID=1855315 RepID=UPI00088416FE|nr:LysR family transcriptional regulator [Cupriavidus sp. YR651]SDD49668.1 DNA-binding transcriptional regulator, LysR family [Cupriavidus sp. YR651]